MVHIRNAREGDDDTIIRFQRAMAFETENVDLEESIVQEGVINVLRDSQKGNYFVALIDDEIVGSLLITREWSDWRNRWVLWIQSVYIKPEHRQKGIYRQMYDFIKAWATSEKEVAGVRLYVDKFNKKAIEVYKKLGMDGDHYRVFEWMKGN